MDGTKVLIVDDEVALAGVIASYFTRDGYVTRVAHTGSEAVEAAGSFNPDLVILDVMLPGVDGLQVCRQVRQHSDCYILMLTARDAEVDKIHALSTGADDYVVKPCSPRELLARASAMLRRPRRSTAGEGGGPITVGGLVIDPQRRTVELDTQGIELTRTEFDILCALAANPTVALSRGRIIEEVWGPGWFGDAKIVDVHVAAIRRKLGDSATLPRYLRTIRGVGYSLVEGS